ncbi:MAG: lipid-A-disaccharide synthase [Alphaproteobacteria bacterium]
MTDPVIFLVAGEPSGDLIGARLMKALKQRTGGSVRFAGVGGERMEEEGLTSLFPMAELTVMGLAEVVPKLFRILGRLRQTARAATAIAPQAVVTIDAPGFSLRLDRRLAGQGIPLIHFVAPQVWAWNPGRAGKIARYLDHLLVLLPFEPPYFEREGLACTFTGHPIVENGASRGNGERFRAAHGIAGDTPLLCVLPGSRKAEVRRLMPIFAQTVARLAADRPGLRVVVPTLPSVAGQVRSAARDWPAPAVVIVGDREKYDAFDACQAGLAASGTITLELALAGLPTVIAYKVNPLTGWIGRRLLTVRYFNLVNLILDRSVIPEFIQGDCRADLLQAAVGQLLDDPAAAEAQRRAATEVTRQIGLGGPSPSVRAADAVLRVIAEKA